MEVQSFPNQLKSASPTEKGPDQIWGVVRNIAFKAIKYALKHHAKKIIKKLPAKFRGPFYKYTNKIVKVLDDFDQWKEGAFAIPLMHAGISLLMLS